MSVPFNSVARTDLPGRKPAGSLRLKQAAVAVVPLALIVLWAAAVRLPFFTAENGDEYFFSIVANEWLRGGLPYVAAFDVKPPGLFLIYAAVQSLLPSSHAVIKGMEIGAVALGAYALFVILRAHGTMRVAIWVAILYPVYTLAFDGTTSVNMLLQLPLTILSFAAILSAVRKEAAISERLLFALLAGLAIGAAGMIKQTAIFEAVAVFAALWIYGDRRLFLSALFVAGAALPAAGFALYFLAAGHFHEMFQAVVVLALHRVNDDVAANYGSDLAYYLTFRGAAENALLRSSPVIFLWGGAVFVLLRFDRIRKAFPTRVLAVAALWLASAFLGAAASRMLDDYYLLTIVPPLLVIAGALYCHGLDVAPRNRSFAFVLSLVAATAMLMYAGREAIFSPDPVLAGDSEAMREVSGKLLALGLAPEDRLLVLNRGLAIYTETGASPPQPYFHPTHLLASFPTPSADPLDEALNANPRFIVIANPDIRHITEIRSRIDRALAYVGQHYRVAAVVNGTADSFTLYEIRG
jgi:hypothetical protein